MLKTVVLRTALADFPRGVNRINAPDPLPPPNQPAFEGREIQRAQTRRETKDRGGKVVPGPTRARSAAMVPRILTPILLIGLTHIASSTPSPLPRLRGGVTQAVHSEAAAARRWDPYCPRPARCECSAAKPRRHRQIAAAKSLPRIRSSARRRALVGHHRHGLLFVAQSMADAAGILLCDRCRHVDWLLHRRAREARLLTRLYNSLHTLRCCRRRWRAHPLCRGYNGELFRRVTA